MPWRAAADPYHVLVSEVMLQQTRVQTVIPYYERWLERFPHVDALAGASVDDVLKQWEGLGYYSRARNLHRAAQMVRERHESAIPSSYDLLRELPGIGEYTAGAVASIAFNQPHAAVDGNVKRVLSRLLDLANPTAGEFQTYAQQLVDRQRPGDFNQAMMELGATICTPRTPSCTACPIETLCHARRNDTVHLRPSPKQRKPLPEENVNTLFALNRGRVLVVQRSERGLLAGLWEFPAITDVAAYEKVGTVTHTFTHKRIHYHVYFTKTRATLDGRWVSLDDLNSLALSTAQRRVAKLVLPLRGS